jgi:serine/threonine-protein kinase
LLRARQKLGKYRILGRIASGPLADVYKAADTIHRTRVALKIPKSDNNTSHEDFLREVQIATRLNHPNILPIQDASFINDHFVIAMALGTESLADRIERRMSTARAFDIADQALAALAHAHEKKIIHCDIKPENFILFPGNKLKLADFGFAKISLRTLKASGSGTIDYIAPEQAMGRPKFQSDVFSLGLVLYRLFSGKLPEWPFKWPMAGHDRLQARVPAEFSAMLKKSMQLDPADRYRNAAEMYAAQPGRSRVKGKHKKAAAPGAGCSGGNFNSSSKRSSTPDTIAGVAMAPLLRACRRVPGVALIIPPGGLRHICRPSARAVNEESRRTGATAPGATVPALKSKRRGAIRTSDTRVDAKTRNVANP